MSGVSALESRAITPDVWLYVCINYNPSNFPWRGKSCFGGEGKREWLSSRSLEPCDVDSQGSDPWPTSLRLSSLQLSWVISAFFSQVLCSAQVAQFEVSGCPESHQTRTGGGIGQRGLHEGGEAQGELLRPHFLWGLYLTLLVAPRSMGDVFLCI